MILVEEKLSRKYAVAFCNSQSHYGNDCSLEKLCCLYKFFSSNRLFQMILNIPSIDDFEKVSLMKRVAEKLEMPKSVCVLVDVLTNLKRIELLDRILKCVVRIYKKKQRSLEFCAYTSHEIGQSQKKVIKKFVSSRFSDSVDLKFEIDSSLISGVKIVGDELVYENSVADKLKNIRKILFYRAVL